MDTINIFRVLMALFDATLGAYAFMVGILDKDNTTALFGYLLMNMALVLTFMVIYDVPWLLEKYL